MLGIYLSASTKDRVFFLTPAALPTSLGGEEWDGWGGDREGSPDAALVEQAEDPIKLRSSSEAGNGAEVRFRGAPVTKDKWTESGEANTQRSRGDLEEAEENGAEEGWWWCARVMSTHGEAIEGDGCPNMWFICASGNAATP